MQVSLCLHPAHISRKSPNPMSPVPRKLVANPVDIINIPSSKALTPLPKESPTSQTTDNMLSFSSVDVPAHIL